MGAKARFGFQPRLRENARMTAADAPPDPTRCPLCGAANACAMATAGRGPAPPLPPCWCRTASFPESLRQRVPAAARGRACICARCAAAAQPHPARPQPEERAPCL